MRNRRPKPPARLCKYQPYTARALTALKMRTIWFGCPANLNDPFDCAVPVQIGEISHDDCVRLIKSEKTADWEPVRTHSGFVDEEGQPTDAFRAQIQASGRTAIETSMAETYFNRGVTCFSEEADSTLLWSHYGGGHRGFCLEFDTSSPWLEKLHRVEYSDEVPVLNIVREFLGESSLIMQVLLRKATCWSYEKEWRAIHMEADTEYCYGVEALTGVYLGAAMSSAEKDVIAHILHGSPTKLYEVRRATDSLRLEIHPATYTPYQYGGGGEVS